MATDYIENKNRLKGVRYMLLAIAAINAVVTIVFSIVSSFLEEPIPMYLQAFVTGVLAYVVPLMLYARTNGVTTKAAEKRIRLQKCSRDNVIYAFLLGIGWQFVMIVISLPSTLLFGDAAAYEPMSFVELVCAIFVIGVIPAIFEELLFRGIVDGSMTRFNSKAAVIFSSVMFAVLHADIYNFIGYILMGVILTGMVRRTDSIYPAMIFHLANNVTALLLGYFNAELVYAPILTITVFAIGIVGFALVYAVFVHSTKKEKSVSNMPMTILLGQSFVSLPTLLCFVILVSATILTRII